MLQKSCDEYLTNFIEKVLIGDLPFELYDKHDQIVFRELSDNKKESSRCRQISIKKCEILFAQKSTEPSGLYASNPFTTCSTFGRLNPFVKRIDNKELWRLADLKEKFSFVSNRTPPTHINTSHGVCIIENSAEIFLLARAKNFRWRVASMTCSFANDAACDRWLAILNGRIKDLARPKNLLVFVNPFGGKGLALRCYKDYVEPLFKLCHIHHKLVTTERANHARDIVLGDDLTHFDGIVSVGGDGLFNEILNGILIRTQNDNAVDLNDPAAELYRARLQLAAIPAGSVNAFAYTLNGTDDPLTAVLHVILGDRRSVDVCSIHRDLAFDRFACIAVSYGFLGDVLRQSERLRCLGPPRYLFAGIEMAIRYPVYRGRIELKLSKTIEKSPSVVQSVFPSNLCHSDCTICGSLNRKEISESGESTAQSSLLSHTYLKEELVKSPETLVLEDMPFLHLIGVITPALSRLSPRGLSPTCHLGDGIMHVAIVEPISRMRNACFIAKVMHKKAHDHLAENYIKVYEVTGFSFLPSVVSHESRSRSCSSERNQMQPTNSHKKVMPTSRSTKNVAKRRVGTWNVDGELFNQSSDQVHFRMHKQLISIFARGIELNVQNNDIER